MKINLKKVTVRDLFSGYVDSQEAGVVGYGGKLNIRPPFQREFVYKEKQRNAVITSVIEGFPLNSMYWALNENETFECLDGQQRTLSLCQYVNGDFSIDYKFFSTQPKDIQEKILNYELQVYVCEGTDSERLAWFRRINIAGEQLTDQELLNANYTGTWLSDAKLKFSKTNCPAYLLSKQYVKGSPIRQDFLETALDWISNGNIADYMSKHQHDKDAEELWDYYKKVITWVDTTFGVNTNASNYRKEMSGLKWGLFYNKYKDKKYDPKELETKVNQLMANEEVTEKKGVYEYLLSGESVDLACKLSKRSFSNQDKRTAYEKQKGICPITKKHFPFEEMQADHIKPWWKGGTTTLSNLQMVSKIANQRKGGK